MAARVEGDVPSFQVTGVFHPVFGGDAEKVHRKIVHLQECKPAIKPSLAGRVTTESQERARLIEAGDLKAMTPWLQSEGWEDAELAELEGSFRRFPEKAAACQEFQYILMKQSILKGNLAVFSTMSKEFLVDVTDLARVIDRLKASEFELIKTEMLAQIEAAVSADHYKLFMNSVQVGDNPLKRRMLAITTLTKTQV